MSDAERIRETVSESVNRITGIPTTEINDDSSFRDDLGLDSLSALEVMVDVEYAFKIKVGEERLQAIQTVRDTITVVQEYLAAAKN